MPTANGDFHQPLRLQKDKVWERGYRKCIQWVEDGMPGRDAVMAAFHIAEPTWYRWIEFYEKDVDAGFTAQESRLIKLINSIREADAELHHTLVANGVDMALDGNVDMTKFLLERRFGYKKPTKEVEVSAKKDAVFNIHITESKPKED